MSFYSYKPLTFLQFVKIIRSFNKVESVEDDLLYMAYKEAVALLKQYHHSFDTEPYTPLNHGQLCLYLLNDYEFRLRNRSVDERVKLIHDDEFMNKFVTAIVDKYGSEALFKYEDVRRVNRYSTEISTLNVYLNFIAIKLANLPIKEENETLFLDLLRNAFSMCRTINELLIAGFEKEALSTWRSLHEVEATLVLVHNRDLLRTYGRHVYYNAAFSGLLSKEKTDEAFVEIKQKMKVFELKSKDTRRFIEYGWIAAHPSFDESLHKFNFRDGVQMLAGLSLKRDAYKQASEAAHSSPLLLFMNPYDLLKRTLVNLYESFLVIEALFADIYALNAEIEEQNIYADVRTFYLDDINLMLDSIA